MDITVGLMMILGGGRIPIRFIMTIHCSLQRVYPIFMPLERVLFSFYSIRVRLGQHVGGRRGLGHSRNVGTRDAVDVFSAKLSFAGSELMSTEQ
jgi:hypothetical protein